MDNSQPMHRFSINLFSKLLSRRIICILLYSECTPFENCTGNAFTLSHYKFENEVKLNRLLEATYNFRSINTLLLFVFHSFFIASLSHNAWHRMHFQVTFYVIEYVSVANRTRLFQFEKRFPFQREYGVLNKRRERNLQVFLAILQEARIKIMLQRLWLIKKRNTSKPNR